MTPDGTGTGDLVIHDGARRLGVRLDPAAALPAAPVPGEARP